LGGWRYSPMSPGDVSVTGWIVMAMQSARMAEIEVPPGVLSLVHDFLDTCSYDDGVTYAYQPGASPRPSMTAEALLMRQYLGWPRDEPRLQQGADYLLTQLPTMAANQ